MDTRILNLLEGSNTNKSKRASSILSMIDFKTDTQENENGCLNWKWSLVDNRYASIYIKGRGSPLGHRLAWELRHGEIPEKMNVLHKCYNKKCLNVDHMVLGTHQDNMQDDDVGKLSKDDILRIREMANSWKYTQKEIAEQFGITQSAVSNIRVGRRWNNIEYPNDNLVFQKNERVANKLTTDNVREIRRLLDEGLKQAEIARMYNVNPSNISRIKSGKRRNKVR